MNLSKLNLDHLETWAKIVGGDGAGKASDPCHCPVANFIVQVVLDAHETEQPVVNGDRFLYNYEVHGLPGDVSEVVEGIDEAYDNENVSGNSVLAIIKAIREG